MLTHVLDQTVSIHAPLLARALDVISVAGMAFTALPPTSIVGAMLWTGYLGNVVVTHFNMI